MDFKKRTSKWFTGRQNHNRLSAKKKKIKSQTPDSFTFAVLMAILGHHDNVF